MQHFPHSVPCWDVFEWQCPGPKEGNPFTGWSHGGTLRGESPRRIAFLRSILSRVPGGALQPNPAGGWDEVSACPAALGQEDQLYLYYYSFMRPAFRDYTVKGTYRVTVIDTWNMRLEDRGIAEGTFRVALPGRPYMAVLLEKQA